jgi:hypothetical protein
LGHCHGLYELNTQPAVMCWCIIPQLS